jgi:hypothetical protein
MTTSASPHFDIQILHGVDEIAAEAWDTLAAGKPFQSHRWYRFGEAVMADSTPSYIILHLDGQPVARAALWPVSDEPLPLSPAPLRSMVGAYLRRRPLMVCRSPLSGMTGLVLPPPPLDGPALQTLARRARDGARLAGASFLVFDFLTPELRDLAPCGLTLGEVTGPGTLMELPWRTFEGFLADLDKNGRKHYKRTQRKCAELGITVTRRDSVDRIPEALRLVRNMERRFGSPPNPWMAGMLEHLELAGGTWLTAEMDGRLVGCELALQDNGAQVVTALGLADDASYAYFALGYEDIRLAIETGAGALYWGSGAYDVKERLGFSLYPNNLLAFAGLGPAPRMIARVASAFM